LRGKRRAKAARNCLLPSDGWRARVAEFDDAVDRAVERVRSPALDGLVYRISSAADHSLLWHFCAVGRSLVRDGDLNYAVRFGAAMSVESVVTNGVIKSFFRRRRPADFADVDFSYGLRRPLTSSFPSGHAAAGFCAATLLGGGPWYLAATAVAGTRVYVRLHHASDVAAGAALGLVLGLVMKRFVGE
jgi:membrane-associated phospholipid phosphatase